MQKDFGRCRGEQLVNWLLQCWDIGASCVELEVREARWLGSPARDAGIGNAVGDRAPPYSFWRRLLSAVKERHPFKEEIVCLPGKWTTCLVDIQFLLGPLGEDG